MKRQRLIAVIGGTALLTSVPLAAAHAADAPPGEADAVVAKVGDLTGIGGHTHAKADPAGSSATGNVIEIGGAPLSKEFGGTQKGHGHSEGGLYDSGAGNSAGRLRLTPWSATTKGDGATTEQADADAALARLVLGDNAVTLSVLQSKSHADWTPTASSGSSSSDGAVANAGGASGLTIVLLHSEASSSGKGSGSSYVLGVNDQKLLTSDQANGKCAIAIPQLLSVNCLAVSGGAGSVTATVANVLVGDAKSTNLPASIVAASASGRAAAVTQVAAPAKPQVEAATFSRAPAAAPSGALPRTGAELWFATMVALSLIGVGWGLIASSKIWLAQRA